MIELSPRTKDDPGGNWPYREAVGSLLRLSNMTPPDIANAVRVVARHSHNPGEEHWKAVLKILSCLRGTKGRGFTFTRGQGLGVSVYVDADYAKKAKDTRSVSGAAVMCGGVSVCWKSTTQKVCQFASYGSRIRSLWGWNEGGTVSACAVLEFLQSHLRGKPIVVFEDNEGAKALAENPLSSAHSKRIDVRHYFIGSLVKCGKIKTNFVSSEQQHADMLTKDLAVAPFNAHAEFLMNLSA